MLSRKALFLFLAVSSLCAFLHSTPSIAQEKPSTLAKHLENLKSKDEAVRLAAVTALGELKAPGPEAIDALCKVLKNPSFDVRIATTQALGKLGAVDALKTGLRSKYISVRAASARALGDIGSAASPAVKELTKALRHSDLWVRIAALRALTRIGPDAASAEAGTKKLLKDQDLLARVCAIRALHGMGKTPPSSAFSILISALNDKEDPEAAATARQTLIKAGRRYVPQLKTALEKGDAKALDILRALGPHAATALISLMKTLKNDDMRRLHYDAIRTLGEIGPQARGAIPMLMKWMRPDLGSDKVNEAGFISIGKIGGPIAIEFLYESLNSKNRYFRLAAAHALIRTGRPHGSGSFDILTKGLAGSYEKEERPHAEALGRTQGKAAVPHLIRALDHEDRTAQVLAAYALLALGPEAADALGALLKKVNGPGRFSQYAFFRAIAAIGGEGIPALIKHLNPRTHQCLGALKGLTLIGPKAKSAVPALEALLKHPYIGAYRMPTAIAIYGIDPTHRAARAVFCRALGSSNMSEVMAAVDMLVEAEIDPDFALPEIRHALEHRDGHISQAALKLLNTMKLDHRIVSSLCRIVRPWNPNASPSALMLLGKLGKDAKAAVPDLLSLLESLDSQDRWRVCLVLEKLPLVSGKAAKQLLSILLTERRGRALAAARRAVEAMGAHAAPAMLSVMKLLTHEDRDQQIAGIRIAGSIGAKAKKAVPELVKLLSSRYKTAIEMDGRKLSVREIAIIALGNIGPAAKRAAKYIKPFLKENRYLARTARNAMERMK